MGTIGIPNGYFLKMAKHDYEDYKKALPREFYQNSVDAGATLITVNSDEEERSITISDDGCGMDRDVLENKLLVLGGSHKAKGSVGAFGKAKELLFFSWEQYAIFTQSWQVEGSGAHYDIYPIGQESIHSNGVAGTIAKIWLPVPEAEDLDEFMKYFKWVALQMRTDTTIMINGRKYEPATRRGLLQKDLDWIRIYQNKSHESQYASVSIDGIWMFQQYVGAGYGMLSFELNRASVEALTSSRDGLKSEYRLKLSKLLEDLMINKKSFLDRRPPVTYARIEGEGPVELIPAEVASSVIVNGHVDMEAVAKVIVDGNVDRDEILVERLESLRKQDADEAVSQLKFLGYKPDFVLKYRAESQAKGFMETTKAKVLAKMWTEVIKQILIDNSRFIRFVAGFTFEGPCEAEYRKVGDEHQFLLNPYNLLNVFKKSKAPLSARVLLIKDLRSRGVHEIAHINHPNHDEGFVVDLHSIEAHTWPSEAVYKRIQKIR